MDKKTAQCPMRLPPELKTTIESLALKDIRNVTEEIIVLFCEAIHFRVNGIRLSPEFFHIENYTNEWNRKEGKKRLALISELEKIKFELEEPK